MRLSGYPIGLKRGTAEQTWTREAICDEEELHRIPREESQGDYFQDVTIPVTCDFVIYHKHGTLLMICQFRGITIDSEGSKSRFVKTVLKLWMQTLHCWWWRGWRWWGRPSSTWLESITFESGEESRDPPWQQTFQIIDTCLSQNQTVWKPDWL